MEYTPLGLRKPELADYASIDDLNYNADLIDEIIGNISSVLDSINGVVI